MDFIYIKIFLIFLKRESSFIGKWHHRLTGELFEIYETREKNEKGGFESVLVMKYLHSVTKTTQEPFKIKVEHINRSINFDLIEKVSDLPC